MPVQVSAFSKVAWVEWAVRAPVVIATMALVRPWAKLSGPNDTVVKKSTGFECRAICEPELAPLIKQPGRTWSCARFSVAVYSGAHPRGTMCDTRYWCKLDRNWLY